MINKFSYRSFFYSTGESEFSMRKKKKKKNGRRQQEKFDAIQYSNKSRIRNMKKTKSNQQERWQLPLTHILLFLSVQNA